MTLLGARACGRPFPAATLTSLPAGAAVAGMAAHDFESASVAPRKRPRSTRRALFFVGAYAPEVLGIGRFVPHYVRALVETGWSVDVLAPYPMYPAWKPDRSVPRISRELEGAVRVTRYAPYVPAQHSATTRSLHEVSIGMIAWQLLASPIQEADVVVVCTPPLLGAASAARMARHYGKPCVVLVYDLVSDLASDTFGATGRLASFGLRAVERALFARGDGVIALTDGMAQRIRLVSGRTSPIPVIRLWADDELFETDHARMAAECRRSLGIPEHRRLVGFAGTFCRKQHLPELMAALRELPSPFTTVFIGEGPYRADMKQLALQGAGDVRVLPVRPLLDLHAFLSACDLSVVPAWTRHSGSLFPSKVANCLAAGAPILALTSFSSELAVLLEREEIGLTCPSLDATQIRDAVRDGVELGRNPDIRKRCRRYAAKHLRRDSAMQGFLAEIDRIAR